MKQLFDLKVKGKNKNWIFRIEGELKYLNDWIEDGLSISPSRIKKPFWLDFSRKKKLMAIGVRGKRHDWSFNFEGLEKNLGLYWEDDLDISIIYSIIPEWVVGTGLSGYYIDFQHFLNKIGL